MLLKISLTSFTQNWFHESCSKLVSQTLLKFGSTSATQNWFHKRYSKLFSQVFSKLGPQVLFKIDPQVLLKIGFTSGTELKNLLACNFFVN